jgi:protein-tyrosine-phosphatase
MFNASFHALGGDCPKAALDIDFRPSRKPNLAGSRGGQDRSFQCQSSDALSLAQAGNKLRHVSVGQGGVVKLTILFRYRPHTVTVAQEIGLDLAAHRARRIDDLTLDDYVRIVTMEESHAHALAAAYPGCAAAIYPLGHLLNLRVDVEDPTGQGLQAHRALRGLLERYLRAALPRLITPGA